MKIALVFLSKEYVLILSAPGIAGLQTLPPGRDFQQHGLDVSLANV